jgi:hypothetical protein
MRSSFIRVVLIFLAATVLACGSGAYGAEEWITVNKDYSSQRYRIDSRLRSATRPSSLCLRNGRRPARLAPLISGDQGQ